MPEIVLGLKRVKILSLAFYNKRAIPHTFVTMNRPLNVRPKILTLRRSVFLWQNIALHLNLKWLLHI